MPLATKIDKNEPDCHGGTSGALAAADGPETRSAAAVGCDDATAAAGKAGRNTDDDVESFPEPAVSTASGRGMEAATRGVIEAAGAIPGEAALRWVERPDGRRWPAAPASRDGAAASRAAALSELPVRSVSACATPTLAKVPKPSVTAPAPNQA